MKLLAVFLFVLLTFRAHGSEAIRVVVPASQSIHDTRYTDLMELLTVALDKTTARFGAYSLSEAPFVMSEARYIVELRRKDSVVNVIWSSTSKDKEADFIPIRIPLRKGLLGYRISLIAKDSQSKFDNLKTLDDLRGLTVGQGLGWGDVALYEKNGFHVITASSYDGLFKMLVQRRFDHFPRGINEVFPEYKTRRDDLPHLAIEQQTLIYYPWPYYFFVSRYAPELAQRIEVGLTLMIADKSFDEIFFKHHGKAIKDARLTERRTFLLDNPFLPTETPLENKALWYDPLGLMSHYQHN
ncbi:substrate-binding periplasmic protein [Hahella sp. NBU794]|uniref:substrate-binding periplasmic protein n=1 Tax=Hahella sp. NBU794 TaxID=3422590 RepID=UPI003D6DF1C7